MALPLGAIITGAVGAGQLVAGLLTKEPKRNTENRDKKLGLLYNQSQGESAGYKLTEANIQKGLTNSADNALRYSTSTGRSLAAIDAISNKNNNALLSLYDREIQNQNRAKGQLVQALNQEQDFEDNKFGYDLQRKNSLISAGLQTLGGAAGQLSSLSKKDPTNTTTKSSNSTAGIENIPNIDQFAFNI